MSSKQGQTRNPSWSRDETILLLDLYLRAPNARAVHSNVVELSRYLNELARPSDAPIRDDFRNPTGIAMKLRNLAQSDPAFRATGRAGLTNGASINAVVWSEFADDPRALAREVERIRRAPASGAPHLHLPTRGPIPTFGSVQVDRPDRETFLYLFTLDGALPSFLPRLAATRELAAMKIGRTQSPLRRREEFNFGFPPGSTIRWDLSFSFAFRGGALAHDAEQNLLAEAAKRSWSIGGEFAVARPTEMLHLARTIAYSVGNDPGNRDQS